MEGTETEKRGGEEEEVKKKLLLSQKPSLRALCHVNLWSEVVQVLSVLFQSLPLWLLSDWLLATCHSASVPSSHHVITVGGSDTSGSTSGVFLGPDS